MAAISDWIQSLDSKEGFDSSNIQDELMELAKLDDELKNNEDMETKHKEELDAKDKEIKELKDRVWDLFKQQSFSDNKNKEDKEDKKKPINVSDFFKH